jgi:hypothetical protein
VEDISRELRDTLLTRASSVSSAGRWLIPNPNLSGDQRAISEEFAILANTVLHLCPDTPELVDTLRYLTLAKDSAIRSSLPNPLGPTT